jgi:tRNA uridine 5-carboxymethylaminomethyl modification enzyme
LEVCFATQATSSSPGVVHIGEKFYNSGRIGEPSNHALAQTLKAAAFPLDRLRTGNVQVPHSPTNSGTPPRLDGRTINYSQLEVQPSDIPPTPFSFMNDKVAVPLEKFITCHITRTTEATHKVVKDNVHHSPKMIDGGKGIGPRYCPSLEAKVVRFPGRYHQVWLVIF